MAERPGSTGGAPLPVWSLPGPRGRSQSDISSFSSSRRTRQLRSNVGGSVDGLDKASVANSDGPAPGSQTPPFKRKGKLSTIGKIFKPWKWRKKKTSDKFRETSAVLERKISTRQSREELIRRGVLKEMPEQDGDVTVNFETSNGHTIAIGEETIQEENVLKASGDNGISSEKASALEGKKEDQKAGSSHVKKTLVSKSSSSPSPSTSSHPKASKETSSKSSTSGTPRGKKKTGKHSAPRTAPDGAASSPSGATANSLEVKAKKLEPEQPSILISETEDANQASKLVVPPPPTSAPPPPPLPPPFPAGSGQPTVSSDAQEVSDGCAAGPAVPGSDAKPPLQAEHGTDDSHALDSGPDAGGGDTKSLATKEDQEGEAPDQAHSELVEEASDTAAPPESESSRESHSSDSDSDGPILYTDDDDDDDDNASAESSLASKIRRRDTLAIKLGNRPSKKELEDKNILQRTSEEERQEIRHQIGTKLVRRLSQRPTTEELEQRNILKQKNEEEEQEAKREIKRKLSRKLSLRPTVAELQARRILRFNEYVEVTDSPDYDRRADKPWARLTPADKARDKLLDYKKTLAYVTFGGLSCGLHPLNAGIMNDI
ncbi:phosphatase and actin regulator 2 isoform X5 [Pezoporus wallicus]|uniref:phosphatase and actin regulator 2 isoform X5 n=1 Tax=Pezoporus wallicus TaxID=35540 RepID=UPI00254CD84B|nr:phosphatase and actin regulator 2 isoform X5 [Pezoporus wallicus]XP_061327678.1 phosphatase and actin regulator 2 isoform X5 [Pezoporus flaviventris]